LADRLRFDALAEIGREMKAVILAVAFALACSAAQATKGKAVKIMAILLNGEIKSAAMLIGDISSNTMMISGNFNREQAEKLADGIKSK
jgi:preprotein translocase subunit SecD